jgi:hypothetical protein
MDLTGRTHKNTDKFERYDSFLTGWAMDKRRYQEQGQPPIVVFVCADEEMARSFCVAADRNLRAKRESRSGGKGLVQHPGRERVFFVAEMDAHQGQLVAYRLPATPNAIGPVEPEVARLFDPRLLGHSGPVGTQG